MARKHIMICDFCAREIESGGAVVRTTFNDARKGMKTADACNDCADSQPGAQTARRGRKPKEVAA